MVLTINELCKYISISRSTEYNMRKAGKIPFFKVGGKVLYEKEIVDEWIKNGGTNNEC